jgi:murein DD-endopeptidase MepM/ murein hydrolase activator NlpD
MFRITLSRQGYTEARTIEFSHNILVVIALIGLFFFTSLFFVVIHYYRMNASVENYTQMENEVDFLKKREQEWRLSAKRLNDRIASLQVTTDKLRILSGWDTDSIGGVGGPVKGVNPVLSLSPRDFTKHFKTMDSKSITLATELRELQDYYTTREMLTAATPSIVPTKGYPSDRYGYRIDPFTRERSFHPGIDITAPKGTKVVATADGLVVYAGRKLNYGKVVTVEHKFGMSTRYGHLDRFNVKSGQRVKKGDIIGYVGTTGRTTGSHLHYEVRLRNQPLNPQRFFYENTSKTLALN